MIRTAMNVETAIRKIAIAIIQLDMVTSGDCSNDLHLQGLSIRPGKQG
jgi:hypothetical protein|tara:strand:+ start:289 stop:432 length:144 start_codon:yes stop_codon:yes gene_type:complete